MIANEQSTSDIKSSSKDKYRYGIDELNLAALPIAALGRRGRHHVLECRVRELKDDGKYVDVIWTVEPGLSVGLPTEFAERVLVVLMALTDQQGYNNPEHKLTFTIYQILKVLDLSLGRENYRRVVQALKQLTGVTIRSHGTFLDAETGERIVSNEGFHILRAKAEYREKEERIRETKDEETFIVWGDVIWNNFQNGYLKYLDLEFYLSLESVIARRLYRILDTKWKYRSYWERDIFEVAARVGLAQYPKPAQIKRKLKPGIEELQQRGFLGEVETIKKTVGNKTYTRLLFMKNPAFQTSLEKEKQEAQEAKDNPLDIIQDDWDNIHAQREAEAAKQLEQYAPYGTTQAEIDLWRDVLTTLRRQMTQATFDAVVAKSMLLELEDGRARIGMNNGQAQDWAKNRMSDVIQRALQNHVENGQGQIVLDFVTLE